MNEMIERIQRAIAPMIQASGPIHAYDSHAMVRAALEAMREPTEKMAQAALAANLDIYWSYEANGEPGGPADVYRAMIDEALQ